MKYRVVALIAVLVAANVVFGVSAASAGWVLTESNGDETIISQGKMKSAWENGAIIFDSGTKEIHFLDDRRKIMASGTIDELCDGITQMVESMMADVPAEQREMMKRMMGGAAEKTEVVAKGPGGKIAGFETTRYEVTQGGELYEELWLSEDESLKKECRGLMQMLMKFSSCMASAGATGAPSPESSPDYLKLFETGVLVKSVEHGDEGEGVNTTVISGRDVPASAFSLPDGYKKVPLLEIWGG
jgi:hypothetical protein